MSEKVTPEELGKLVEDFAKREEWGGVETLSDAEREARLASSGIDREKARAIGDRVHAKMEAAAKANAEAKGAPVAPAPAKVIPLAPRRRTASLYVSLLVAASVGAILVSQGSAIVAWVSGDDNRTVAGGFDGGPGYEPAHKLRFEAGADYAAGRYAECLRKLDEATRLYPPAAKEDDVVSLRRRAEAALAGEAGVRE